jgi:LacI family transcriptional regulator/LacI family fructose operon transcriptional repressor
VGLLLSTVGHERTERLNGAAYWIEQKSENFFANVPPLFMTAWDRERFTAWYDRQGIEALVTSNDFLAEVEAWSAQRPARRGRELQLINVNAEADGRVGGIFQDPFNIGGVATLMLIDKISRNERGIPARRQTTLTPGQWVEGKTPRAGPGK